MLGHNGGARGCQALVADLPADTASISVLFNDEVPAEAGLWALLQALRGARGSASSACTDALHPW